MGTSASGETANAKKDHEAIAGILADRRKGNGFPATGRTIRARGLTIFGLVGGRIIEEWSSFDQSALLQQLGLIPE